MMPDIELLRSVIDCDPQSGTLTWRERDVDFFVSEHAAKIWNAKYPGTLAFNNKRQSGGYLKGLVFGKTYAAHRVMWAMATGEWPPAEMDIDHINGVRDDNRLINLRLATRAENARNRGALRPGKFCGVSKRGKKWVARCKDAFGKYHERGGFLTDVEAAGAYDAMAVSLHGAFAKLNFQESQVN
jgi:hypothetical protein